jgi:HAD superfamily hydrolase (TIGR01549 family)
MPLHVSRIRALIFDIDGTLSDTDDLFVQKLEPVLRPFRFLFRNRDSRLASRRFVMWSEAPGNILLGIPDTLGLDGKISALMQFFNHRYPRQRKDFLLIPGVKEMLQVLSTRYPLAIVSVRDENTTRRFLDHFGLTPFFQVIVTGQTVEHTKPYPDPIFYAARALAVPPEACLVIGDTTVDIRAGKAAGAQALGVLCGFGEELELRRCGADMLLDTTPELVHVLAGW